MVFAGDANLLIQKELSNGFKITEYAQRLLMIYKNFQIGRKSKTNAGKLIGKSKGIEINFVLEDKTF